jgi:hypothetical protein
MWTTGANARGSLKIFAAFPKIELFVRKSSRKQKESGSFREIVPEN